jgi:PhnB protein
VNRDLRFAQDRIPVAIVLDERMRDRREMSTRIAVPDGYHTLTPRMVVSDVAGAVAFLRVTFGATGDIVDGRPTEVMIGDSVVMVSPAGERDPFPTFLYVYVADADVCHRRAVAAGAETIEAPLDTPYGDRRAMVRDPYGNLFQIAHRVAADRE